MSAPQIIPPGSTIGILGVGQLGRMTALAAARLGCKVSTVSDTRQRLGKVEHELDNLACACRLAGEMSEETREAFEGVAR